VLANLGSDPHLCGHRTIVVADDNPVMRCLIKATLADDRLEILEAADGTATLAFVADHHPMLVILDGRMPAPDGFAVCNAIKSDPNLEDIVVVMVTANPGDESLALHAGANAHLTKPYSPLGLLQIIDELLPAALIQRLPSGR
jgi:CheY-like chemotaxis protein